MRWVLLSGIVLLLLGALIYVGHEDVVCTRAVQAGVGMVVTADHAFEMMSGCRNHDTEGCDTKEFHAAVVASELFEKQFRQLAKECLQ